MRRKIGPSDITYCSTYCLNESCKRNLQFYKPSSRYVSRSAFDKNNKDELHLKCPWKLEAND